MSDVELPEPSEVVNRYEVLRTAAIEGEPASADGLALFYQCGMWAWARSAVSRPVSCPSPPARVPTTAVSPVHAKAALARILAQMALGNPTLGGSLS